MSLTFTITGNKSLLETCFQPPLNVDGDYECGLLFFSALNCVPNIHAYNNVFAYGKNVQKLHIPHGNYDLYDLLDYLTTKLDSCEIKIKPNNNTLKCLIYCNESIRFDVENSIGNVLGFDNVILEANKWHESKNTVNILPLSAIRIECDLVQGSYTNGLPSHILHEFVPNVPPGHRFIELPQNIIYFPINKTNISEITLKIIDLNGNYVNFQKENIILRLHLRRTR